MKRKWKAVCLLMAAALTLAGCGNAIPEMTDEEMQAVGEYAAITLLKYDANHRSRLVDLEVVAQAEAEEKARAQAQAQAKEQAGQEEAGGMRPTEDTPVIGADGTQESAAPATMEEILKLPEGMTITYRENEICESYPRGSENAFAISATAGNQLLVLHFDLYNGSGQDQDLDLISLGLNLKVTVNDSYTRRALTTMLPGDLVCYRNTVAADATVEVAAVIEVPTDMAGNVSSLKINLKNESDACTIQLL